MVDTQSPVGLNPAVQGTGPGVQSAYKVNQI